MFKNFFIDSILFIFLSPLLIVNLLMLYSSSNFNLYLLYKTIFHIFLGFLIIYILSKISYIKYKKFAILLYILSIIFLILTYFFGYSIKGACRWIKIGVFKFQPSEITKISIPLISSYFINKYGCPNSFKSLFIYFLILLIPSFFILIQPDLGTTVLITFSGIFILFISGIKYKKILFLFLISIILMILNWKFVMKDYQKNRIFIFFNKNFDPNGAGYHIIQSKIAIGSGGFFGKGLFKGTQSRLKFIPEKHTDFIFSVIAEELGFFGIIFIIILYLCLILRMLYISIIVSDVFFKILISYFTLIFFLNIFINISMVIGILPVVGIPLPLISYGGTSIIINFVKIGIINSFRTYKTFHIKY